MQQETNEPLKREVGLFGLTTNMINSTIGAGIYALPAIVAAGLGAAGIFTYLICAFLISLIMLCFAEVGSKITTSGGPYTYIESSFGPYFGFLTVNIYILAGITGDAAIANAFVDIISSVIPLLKLQFVKVIFFFIVFSALTYINIKGVKEGITLVKIITISKLVPLLFFVLFAWGHFSFDNLSIDTMPAFGQIGKLSLILFFAFVGAEVGLCISGEIKNPQKTIPKALLISISGVLILYMLIQTVAQGVLGDNLSAFKENPLSAVANQAFGPVGFTIMTLGAAISMFGILSSEVLSMPRTLFQAAKDRVLPIKYMAKIHPKFHTPHISIIAYASMGFLLASLGGFEQLAIISTASNLLVYLGVSLSVIKLRRTKEHSKEPSLRKFKIPGGYLVPILSALIIVWLLSNMAQHEVLGMGLFILAFTLIYFFIRKILRKPLI